MSVLKPADVQERLNAYMRTHGMKLTRQREVILDTFLSAGKHVGAEEMLARVRKRMPGVGHATVYRTMRLLVEAGIADERNFSTGVTLYEPHHGLDHHHDHLICTSCGLIVEFGNLEIERLQDEVAEAEGFALSHHKMELYGLCRSCQDPS